jgi:hypothetical protein
MPVSPEFHHGNGGSMASAARKSPTTAWSQWDLFQRGKSRRRNAGGDMFFKDGDRRDACPTPVAVPMAAV